MRLKIKAGEKQTNRSASKTKRPDTREETAEKKAETALTAEAANSRTPQQAKVFPLPLNTFFSHSKQKPKKRGVKLQNEFPYRKRSRHKQTGRTTLGGYPFPHQNKVVLFSLIQGR